MRATGASVRTVQPVPSRRNGRYTGSHILVFTLDLADPTDRRYRVEMPVRQHADRCDAGAALRNNPRLGEYPAESLTTFADRGRVNDRQCLGESAHPKGLKQNFVGNLQPASQQPVVPNSCRPSSDKAALKHKP